MFELWLENNMILPFAVRSMLWSIPTHFDVRAIHVNPNMWRYFRDGGMLFGKAYGDFINKPSEFGALRGLSRYDVMSGPSQYDVELRGACFFEWKFV